MDDGIEHISNNARIIGELLTSNVPPIVENICNETTLDEKEVYLAIGWLANENEQVMSELNNIITDFDKKVQRVCEELYDKSKKSIATIAKMSDLKSKETYAVLGFLACKNKIVIFKGKTLQTKYSLRK